MRIGQRAVRGDFDDDVGRDGLCCPQDAVEHIFLAAAKTGGAAAAGDLRDGVIGGILRGRHDDLIDSPRPPEAFDQQLQQRFADHRP